MERMSKTFDNKVQRKLAKWTSCLTEGTLDKVGAIFIGETDVLFGEILHNQLKSIRTSRGVNITECAEILRKECSKNKMNYAKRKSLRNVFVQSRISLITTEHGFSFSMIINCVSKEQYQAGGECGYTGLHTFSLILVWFRVNPGGSWQTEHSSPCKSPYLHLPWSLSGSNVTSLYVRGQFWGTLGGESVIGMGIKNRESSKTENWMFQFTEIVSLRYYQFPPTNDRTFRLHYVLILKTCVEYLLNRKEFLSVQFINP